MTMEIQKDWRLVHNNKTVILFENLQGAKTTPGAGLIFKTFDAREDGLAEIVRLGLEYIVEEFD